jgi:signal peptidase I
VTVVRPPLRPDYRLRSLDIEPTEYQPATPARIDGSRRRRRRVPGIVTTAVLLAVAVLTALLLQRFVVQSFSVPGDAMAPALQAGDRLLAIRPGALAGPVKSGDIIVFRPWRSLPCASAGGRGGDLVLRVVALPGQTIWSAGSTIFVDGRPLRDRGWYDPRFGQLGSTPIARTALGPGQYYALADNRSDACDSRVFGPVPESSIVGRGIAIVGRYGHVFLRML